MKKIIIGGLIALAAVTVSTTSCNKYEDGPAFSLLTKKSRLCGEWVIDKYFYNDVDQTTNYNSLVGANYVLEIEKDGNYRTEGSFTDNGTWELGEDKDDVRMKSNQANSSEVSYRILRLKSKELWLRYTAPNGDIEKFYYKAK